MVRFRVLAMYVRTELVHTYIAKRPSFLLYRFLAVPKMGTATSIIKIWVGDSPTPCWQGKGVVKHDSWNNISSACDQIGHSQFKGVTNGYTLWSLSPNGSVPTLYIRT